ncbi:hypothetical protein AB0L13_11385 [Saccharopolyspora shandongensis]|uniref:hypothetical protein n=1 Tax=Saccharopolyspora shandongensis TaxID=418495 RepID=UPI003424049D
MAHASVEDLAAYAGHGAVTDDSPRLLDRGSELIDSLLVTAVYDPSDERIRDALRRATCAVVQWWHENGDESGTGVEYSAMQIGTVRLQRAAPPPPVPPAAARILATAGLLQHPPSTT